MRGASGIGADPIERSGINCTWCGNPVEAGDGYRLGDAEGNRGAVFCRLEHLVPWGMQGSHWETGQVLEAADLAGALSECAHCGAALGVRHLRLVRHRAEHRIPDGFCSPGHLISWAKAGGRWRS